MPGAKIASKNVSLSQMEIQKLLTESMIELNRMNPCEIAQYLSHRGIQAQRGCSTECAISRHMLTEYEWADTVLTNPRTISAYPCAEYNVSTATSLAPYPNVQEFIRMFDSGYFPNLVEKNQDL